MLNNFITNSGENSTLRERLQKLTGASSELKFLVGFFYFSGWQEIYKSLQKNDTITLKILVGLQVDKYLSGIVEVGSEDVAMSNEEHFTQFMKSLGIAINNAEMDNEEFYGQIDFFIHLLEDNRLIIRKTYNPNHAKLYIFKLAEKYQDIFNTRGQFITGSSNLTKAGLHGREEFNVEIRDYGFKTAEEYFDQLWATATPVTEAENGKQAVVDFLKNKTISSLITPYEAYAYILQTYLDLQENKKINSFIDRILDENGFEKYTYQLDAVNQALNIIDTYNGVIIADVVGLGKSVIASLIASQLGKRGLILCPPGLIGNKRENTGWWEYWNKFKLYDWDIESTGNLEADQEELLARLKDAVKVRLIAEVPLGAFLSGGVDSSAVVSQMAELSQNEPVNTCSISFGDPEYNEIEYADLVAKRFNTKHNVKQVDPNDYELLDSLSNMYDEPFADSSSIPTYRVCELARKHVTVALSGDGGDENLAGYRRHRWHMLEESVRGKVPQFLRKPVFGALGRFYPKMDWAPKIFRAKTTFQAISENSIDAYLNSVSITNNSLRSKLFSGSFKNELAGYNATEVFHYHAKRSPTDHPLSLIQYIDMKTYLPGDILTKVDRASMANSLEVRVPLLDHQFVEWVSGLSPDVKLKGREGKYIFKRALEKQLPDSVLYRSKMGFAVPLAKWFRGPLREKARTAILGEQLNDIGIFNSDFLRRVIDEHQTGAREHSAIIWSLLMFEAFIRREMT